MALFNKNIVRVTIGCALSALAFQAHAEGTLKTGVDANFPPHAMRTMSGGLEGFNIDLGNEIARRLHEKIDIDGTEFSGLLPGLLAKKYDFILAPVTVTAEKAKSLLFSEGYLNTDSVFLQPKTATPIARLEDLKGKTIAVNKGSSYERWAMANASKYGFKYASYGSNADAIQAILAGRADANLDANTVSGWTAKKDPALKITYTMSTAVVSALAFRPDDRAGRDRISMALKCMKHDGYIAKLSQKWFGFTPGPDSAAVVIAPGQGVPGLPGYDPTPVKLTCN